LSALNFYQKPAALNREAHRNLKIDADTPNFAFAAKSNSLLLALPEIVDAAASYPVVFVGGDNGPYSICAMVGLSNEQNLFLDADGNWDQGSYIPAFVRRYPFVLSSNEQEPELVVCIDESFAGFSTEKGSPLFDADGKETALLENAIALLRNFHAEMDNTNAFCKRLADLGLLIKQGFELKNNGHTHVVEGTVIVDAEKLAKLDDATTLAMVRNGDMALVYAHLLSIRQITHLSVRHEKARQAAA
jgi:hypothetical protein